MFITSTNKTEKKNNEFQQSSPSSSFLRKNIMNKQYFSFSQNSFLHKLKYKIKNPPSEKNINKINNKIVDTKKKILSI